MSSLKVIHGVVKGGFSGRGDSCGPPVSMQRTLQGPCLRTLEEIRMIPTILQSRGRQGRPNVRCVDILGLRDHR